MTVQTRNDMEELGADAQEITGALSLFNMLEPGLRVKKDGRIPTTWGDKTVLGLYYTIRRKVATPSLLRLAKDYLADAEERVSQVRDEIDSGLAQPEDLKAWTDKVASIRAAITRAD